MKKIFCLLLVCVLVLGMFPGTAVATGVDHHRVTELVSTMSIRDKVTQMLMVDFRLWGQTASAASDFTVMNNQVRRIVEDYKFGAVLYFANNLKDTEQSFALTQAFQAAATKNGGIPLMIAADQEGGSVYRLATGTALPGNMALGATYGFSGTDYAYRAGKIIGSELAALGINTDLAPVLDVNNNPNNPVIGLRSYGDDAAMVGALGAATINGLAEYNVVGCAKHFPGHGDTATDSHYGLPIVDKSLSVLKKNELKPYEVAIDEGIEMIMTAHILYPQLESDKIMSTKTGQEEALPATMSDDILTGLLKKDMGFEGIIVTDAMNMKGITDQWDAAQAVTIAIQAGVDMICMPCRLSCEADLATLDRIIGSVMTAVEDGTIPMGRIDDAVTRILTVKENRGILDYKASDYQLEKAKKVVGSGENRGMERQIAAAAVTVIKNRNDVLPLKLKKSSRVLMLVPYGNEQAQMIMGWNRGKEAGVVPEGAQVRALCFGADTSLDSIKANLDWADIYIINSEISSAASGRMKYGHWLSRIPNEICDYAHASGKTAIISSVDKPYDVQLYPNADAIVAAYGCKGSAVDPTEALIGGVTGSEASYGPNIIAAVEVILGTFEAKGNLPISIPKYDAKSDSYTNEILYQRGYGLRYREKTFSISGTVTSFRDNTGEVTIRLYPQGGTEPCDQVVVCGNRTSYTISDVPVGTYTMTVSKQDHVKRSYTVTVTDSAVWQDVKISFSGDVNGDGKVNLKDWNCMNEADTLQGYWRTCGDMDGDGKLSDADRNRLWEHLNETVPLGDNI